MEQLIVCALEMETQAGEVNYPILYTGVGKVNAAIALTSYIEQNGIPSMVINFGTAGSKSLEIGKLVECTKFVQRDMDKTALGFKKGETAFETDIPMLLDFGDGMVCGTGDNFVQDVNKELEIIDVYDMEAYALAKVCYIFNVPFASYKYITDNANEKSAKDWESNLADGIKKFEKLIISHE